MYESSTKETKWACIQLACSWRPRAFEESHHWNIQDKFYNEKFPLVCESDKIRDSLSWRSWCYFEAQVWKKKDSSIVPFIFIYFFIWPFFFFGLSLFFGISLFWPFYFFFFFFFFWDNALLMMIITLLFIHNSKITTRY